MNENLTGSPSRRRPSPFQDLALHAENPDLLAQPREFLALLRLQGSHRPPPRVDIGLADPSPDGRLGQIEVTSDLDEAAAIRVLGLLPDQRDRGGLELGRELPSRSLSHETSC